MASFWSFLAMLMVFMAYFTSMLSAFTTSKIRVQFSTMSAAPAVLPYAPLSSPPGLSPDIEPLFPTPGADIPSPTESSLPIIPSSPSPPNPDDILAPGPGIAVSPSGSLPTSSSVRLITSSTALFLGLMVFCIMQLFGTGGSFNYCY